MTIRFRRIDGSNIGDHSYLREADTAFFLHEFTSGRGYEVSDANQLIFNLKKKHGANGQQWKARAINRCIREVAEGLNSEWLKIATLVPVPPSKITTDPLFDDRMRRVCDGIGDVHGMQIDVRDIVRQKVSTEPFHSSPVRPSVADLQANYEIDERVTEPAPAQIGIVDDVLTAGTHFRAMHNILSGRFPGVPIVGIFIARRVFPNSEAIEFFEPIPD